LSPQVKEALVLWLTPLVGADRKRADLRSDDDTHDRVEALVVMAQFCEFTPAFMQRLLETAKEF
jgi:hypothetical protein